MQIAFATKPFRPERSLPQAAPEWRLLVLDPLAPASCTSTGTYNQRASWQVRPDLCTTLAAGGADEVRLDVRQPDMIGPAVSVGFDVMAAAVIAAIDQDVTGAGSAHLAEGDFLRVGVMYALIVARPSRPPPAFNADPRGIAEPTLRTKAKATGYLALANRCDAMFAAPPRRQHFSGFAN